MEMQQIDNWPYLISNDGKVFSTRSQRYLTPDHNNMGYERVCLHQDGYIERKFVHRLVAEAFVPNPDPQNKTQVNHKDGDKQNNNAANLEWVTPAENSQHAYATGLHLGEKKHGNFRRVLSINPETLVVEKTYASIGQAAIDAGCTNQDIDNICRRTPVSRVFNGHKWCYEDWLESLENKDKA